MVEFEVLLDFLRSVDVKLGSFSRALPLNASLVGIVTELRV